MRLHLWAAGTVAKFPLLSRLAELESHQAHVHVISYLGFAIPANGFGMAWVPQESKDGDAVAIIAGHDAPIVLRRVTDDDMEPGAGVPAYQFVGEAFFLGMMGGRCSEEWRAGRAYSSGHLFVVGWRFHRLYNISKTFHRMAFCPPATKSRTKSRKYQRLAHLGKPCLGQMAQWLTVASPLC